MASVAVKDANILIDCAEIGILEEVFQLPFQFKTTDLVWEEVSDGEQKTALEAFVEDQQLELVELSIEEISHLQEIEQNFPGLSIQDCSAMYLAEKEGGILLTGDGKLRKTSTQEGIEVHGMLWLLRELFEAGFLDKEQALEKVKTLKSSNMRLPRAELDKVIKEWG